MKGIIKTWMVIAVMFILTGIILGAFGAHALKAVLTEQRLASFDTAVRYQIWMGLGLALQVLTYQAFGLTVKKWIGRLLIAGTLGFSVSIYVLVALPPENPMRSVIGPITPIGGTLMILSWGGFLYHILRSKSV